MKKVSLIAVALFSAGLSAQDAIPGGTILPVQLNSPVKSDKARSGQLISGRIMQDVPLTATSKIRVGAKVVGQVVSVRPAREGNGAEIVLRFDTVAVGSRRIHVTTNLRALANMMEVSEAQVPESGPDRGTSENSWTTDQIGGEVNYHGGVISKGLLAVGNSVPNGALVRVASKTGTKCRGEVDANHEPQALWVFASDACGLYGLPDVTLTHAGRIDPIGEIILSSKKGSLNIRAGSGMLLRVNDDAR